MKFYKYDSQVEKKQYGDRIFLTEKKERKVDEVKVDEDNRATIYSHNKVKSLGFLRFQQKGELEL